MDYSGDRTGSLVPKPELGSCRISAGSATFTVHGGVAGNGRCVTCGVFLVPVSEMEWRRRIRDEQLQVWASGITLDPCPSEEKNGIYD